MSGNAESPPQADRTRLNQLDLAVGVPAVLYLRENAGRIPYLRCLCQDATAYYMSAIDVRDRELKPVEEVRLNEVYRDDLAGVLIPRHELTDRVSELGTEITERYRSNPDFYPICILKGAMRFFVDLMRNLDLDVAYSEGVVHSSRYHAGPDVQTPAVEFFQKEAIAGKDVLLVEDILDEGYTLATLRDRFQEFDPNSLRIVTLLDTAVDRDVDIDPAYTGFRVPDAFYVGYGLDYDERYRDLRHLGVLDSAVLAD